MGTKRLPTRWAATLACVFALLQCGVRPASAAVGEYPVKAAVLFNFAQFVEWPPASFSDPKAPLIIAVLGEDPFNGALERAIAGKSVGGHPMEVRHFATANDVTRCHMLFVSAASQEMFAAAQQRLAGANVLTVGEGDGFATSAGGIARLYTEDSKIRFEINRAAADKASLHISAKLLKLAKLVG